MRIDGIKNVSVPQTSTRPVQENSHQQVQSSTANEVVEIKETAPLQNLQKEAVKATEERDVEQEMLDRSIKQANKSLEQFDRMIERSVHEKTKTIMYVIRDTKTHEVIREFPPKKIQDMIAKMWELAGLFVDERA